MFREKRPKTAAACQIARGTSASAYAETMGWRHRRRRRWESMTQINTRDRHAIIVACDDVTSYTPPLDKKPKKKNRKLINKYILSCKYQNNIHSRVVIITIVRAPRIRDRGSSLSCIHYYYTHLLLLFVYLSIYIYIRSCLYPVAAVPADIYMLYYTQCYVIINDVIIEINTTPASFDGN